MTLKLSDSTIAQIAKCIQVAILTGTDIVDHLRQLELEVNDSNIAVTKEYLSTFETNIEKMLQEATSAVEESTDEKKSQAMEQISLFS